MIKKILTIIVLLSGIITAQDLSGVAGAFADIGFGARPAALGGAFTAAANDVHSIMWNPAGLAQLERPQAAFTFTSQLGLVNYHYLAASMPLGNNQNAGIAVISSGDEMMREFTLQGAYARSVLTENLLVGVTVKFRYASFGNNNLNASDYSGVFEPDEIETGIKNQVKGNAPGFGLDLGVLYKLNNRIHLGLMLKDIYSPVFWNSHVDNPEAKTKGKYTELIPFEPVVGTSFMVSENLMLTSDYAPGAIKEMNDKFRMGVEARLLDVLSLRGGYQNFINHEKDEKYTVGIGLDREIMKNLRVIVDYTIQIEELANSHRFGLGLEF